MGGGLLQLVAYGAQDVYLTGNPQITFFKVVYRRHTNFAMEAIEQTYNGNTNFGSRVSVLITRNGDLINRVYFNGVIKNTATPMGPGADWATDNKDVGIVSYFGQKLLKNVELEIGGQRIDKHYSEWLYIWNELTMTAGKKSGYDKMVGGHKDLQGTRLSGGDSYELYVPLEFWFCRNVGLALPLIALQYHEVKVNIEFCQAGDLIIAPGANVTLHNANTAHHGATDTTGQRGTASDLSLDQAKMWVDYIFLDTDERRRFAQLSHEYLIEQLQFTGSEQITGESTKGVRMNFNHPCKELIWTVKKSSNQWNDYSSDQIGTNPVTSAKIQLNGNDRFAERSGDYFSLVQPYQHHECVPNEKKAGINVYSFALKPEEHQPSGTLNMSRIDTAVLSLSAETGLVSIYAVNYNVLRILSGMGGLAYSN